MLHTATSLLKDTVKHAAEIIDAAGPTSDSNARRKAVEELERILAELGSKVEDLRQPAEATGDEKTEVPGLQRNRPGPVNTHTPRLLPWQKSQSKVAPLPQKENPVAKKSGSVLNIKAPETAGLRQWDQSSKEPPSQSRRVSFLSAVRDTYNTNESGEIGTQMSLPIEEYPEGAVIVEQDVYLRCMYIIKSGSVDILKKDLGEPIAELQSPAYFGEISMFCGRPTTATVRAKTATAVYVLPQDRLAIMRDKFPESIQRMLQTAAKRLKEDILRTIADKDSNRGDFGTMLEVIDKQLVKLNKQQSHLLHPHSRVVRIWEWLMAWCLLYVLIITPYESAFLKPRLNTLFWVNRVVDLIYLIDMVMAFFLIYEVNSHDTVQVFVKDKRKIAQRYLRTYFLVDFLALLACPLDIAAVQSDTGGFFGARLLRMCKIFRLLKIQRFVSSTRIFRILETSELVSYRVVNLVSLLIFLVTLSHCMACTAGLMAKLEAPSQKTWVTVWAAEMHEVDADLCLSERIADGSIANIEGVRLETNAAYWEGCYTPHSLYIACLYWAVMTVRLVCVVCVSHALSHAWLYSDHLYWLRRHSPRQHPGAECMCDRDALWRLFVGIRDRLDLCARCEARRQALLPE
jgi:CRP-like cAMP-binding protein